MPGTGTGGIVDKITAAKCPGFGDLVTFIGCLTRPIIVDPPTLKKTFSPRLFHNAGSLASAECPEQTGNLRSTPMTDDDKSELEFSPLSGEFASDGNTLQVQIYRFLRGEEGSILEVIDREGTSTVWDAPSQRTKLRTLNFFGPSKRKASRPFLRYRVLAGDISLQGAPSLAAAALYFVGYCERQIVAISPIIGFC